MSPGSEQATYISLAASCERIDRRHTGYRFDLETDVAWDRLDEPGAFFGPSILRGLGIDAAALEAEPAAAALFGWAFALATCEEFCALEEIILRFTEREADALGPVKSVTWLCEEERKHIRLFRRIADRLRARRPDDAVRFDRLFAPSADVLGHLDAPERFGARAVHHYIFWLNTLFFEEYTVWVHQRLADDAGAIQPTWLDAHRVHRQEEVQHLITDARHLAAVNLSEAERAHWSKAFFFRLERRFASFLGLAAPLALVGEDHPALEERLRPTALRETPFFADVLRAPTFRQTRRAAPYVAGLALAAPAAAPADARAPADAPRAELHGPPHRTPPEDDETLADRLQRAATAHATAGIVHVEPDGGATSCSYGELLARAEVVLGGLRRVGAERGETVVLMLGRNEDFVPFFWACLIGGLVPVPLALPTTMDSLEDDLQRVADIHARLGDPLVVVDPIVRSFIAHLPAEHVLRRARLHAPDEVIAGAARARHWSPAAADEPAMIQFSSGSTRSPRGVTLTHRNILWDLQATIERHGAAADDTFVSWMPLYHDMGLLGYHVVPLLCGATQVLMSPLHFVKEPLQWLRKLHQYRGTISASPTFGYSRTLRALQAGGDARELDLSRVRVLLNGAEPISVPVMRDFLAALAPAGLRPEAMCPAYGLAEATVAVSMNGSLEPPREHVFDRTSLDSPEGVAAVAPDHPDAVRFVDVGRPVAGVGVRVVGRDGRVVAPGVVGSIEVSGPNVTRGYWRDAEATAAAVREDGWLRTGDLGLVIDGRLCVTGREKDIIFINGRNFYAHDLEEAALEVDGVGPGRVVVVGSTDPETGRERVVVFCHPREDSPLTDEAVVFDRLRRHLTAAVGFPVDHVVPIHPEEIPKTSSGKLQRYKLRRRFERGEFDERIRRVEALAPAASAPDRWWRVDRRRAIAAAGPATASPAVREGDAGLADVVAGIWSRVLGVPPERVGRDAPFAELGGDSIAAVEVHGRIETRFGLALDQRLLLSCRTVREMAAFLQGQLSEGTAAGLERVHARPRPRPPALERDDIAVIAMAGRFPGAPTLDAFWELLRDGRCALTDVPADRWDRAAWHDDDPRAPGKIVCPRGGFIDGVYGFDPDPFGLTEHEAAGIDPQQRLFLELAADALDAAGLESRHVGVFAAAGGNDYFMRFGRRPERIGRLAATGNLDNMVAARVAAILGLTGPAFTVNAACASSLVAVHLACRSLRAGECAAAIAGGAELNLTPIPFLLFSQAGVLSPRGRCEPFGRAADGFVPGEGGGAVLLRPLRAALADGDPILGVIRGSAVNNDGGALSGMAPNPAGQRDVIAAAYADAGVDPASVGYVEAHAAGTPIGDPVEVRALAQVFSGFTEARGACGIGSVKGNVGHLFTAAGVTSLLKVLLALRHRELPPTLFGEALDDRIGFAATPFAPVRRPTGWTPPAGAPRRAGISALGIGGTNCHLVLEQAPPAPAPAPAAGRSGGESRAALLCLSAPTDDAVARVAASYAEWLGGLPARTPIAEVAGALAPRAGRWRSRRAVVAGSVAEARERLAAGGEGVTAAAVPRVVLVFGGPGSQYPGMGRHLLDDAPEFREALLRCETILRPLLDEPLTRLIYDEPDAKSPAMDRIELTQPVMFAFEYALARWLMATGLRPDAVMGHSAGEYVAACLAGALGLEEALAIVTARGEAMARTEPGRMAAVFAPPEKVAPMLAGRDGAVSIAAINEPGQVVISGREDAVEDVTLRLEQAGIASRPLRIGCAAHSALMAPAQEELAAALEQVEPRPPAHPFFSTVTGDLLPRASRDYWREQLRAPVRFARAVETAAAAGYSVFVEVAANGALSHCIAQTVPEAHAIPLIRHGVPGWEPTLEALGRLFELGVPLDPRRLPGGARRARVALPPYPYRRRRLVIEEDLGDAPAPAPEAVERTLTLDDAPAVAGHRAGGRAIAPAVMLIDQALAASAPAQARARLRDVLIGRPLEIGDGQARRMRARAGGDGVVRVQSRPEPGDGWEDHLTARVAPVAAEEAEARIDLAAIEARCGEALPVERVYDHLAASGLRYGEAMRGLVSVRRGGGEVLARVRAPRPERTGPARWIDPAVGDGAMQAIGALTIDEAAEGATYLGFAVGEVDARAPAVGEAWAHVRLASAMRSGAESFRCDVTLADDDGRVLVALREVALKRADDAPRLRLHEVRLERAPLPPPATDRIEPRRVLIGGGAAGALDALSARLLADGHEVTREPREGAPPQTVVLIEPRYEDVLDLVQRLQRAGVRALDGPIVVSDTAAFAGLMRVLAVEEPGWRPRVIEQPLASSGAREQPSLEGMTERIIAEWRAPFSRRVVVYAANGDRSVPALRPCAATDADGAATLPEKGVWAIAGGAGGIGLAIACELALRSDARLLLMGRREAADADALARIEAAGGEALYARADVTDEAAVAAALDLAAERWGAVHAIVHAAGVLDEGLIRARDPARRTRVLAPKIDGAEVLIRQARARGVPRLVLFSSLAALFGRAGQGDYAAANAALGGLARVADDERPRVLAIHWGPWREVGMTAAREHTERFEAEGLPPLTPEQGRTAFVRALGAGAAGAREVTVAVLDPARERALAAGFDRPPLALAATPGGAALGDAPPVADFVVDELAAGLRVPRERIDARTPWSRLGVDSLMAVGLVRKIEARYGLRLYPTLLFELTTLEELVEHLATLGVGRPRAVSTDSVSTDSVAGDVRVSDDGSAPIAPPVEVPGLVGLGEAGGVDEAWVVSVGEGLLEDEVPIPRPGPEEVEIDVRAVGVNFIDLLGAVGMHPTVKQERFVPGHEVAGVVRRVGAGVSGIGVGDRVAALLRQGGYARRAVASVASVVRLPAGVSFEEGAAVLVSGITAIACLEHRARLRAGERVLVQAAAGATGTACVQLALHLGATVFGTAGGEHKLARLRALGVHHAIDYRTTDFDDAVRAITDGEGVDVIVDSLSGEAIARGLAVLRPGGRFVEIGAAGVIDVPPIDPRALFAQGQSFLAVNVGRLDADPALLRRHCERLLELLGAGVIEPAVGHQLRFEEAPRAHALLRERRNVGKVVLRVE